MLEYDDERSGDFEPLSHVPEDKVAVLGLVTTKTPRRETEEELEARLREASRLRSSGAACPEPAVWLRHLHHRQRHKRRRRRVQALYHRRDCGTDLGLAGAVCCGESSGASACKQALYARFQVALVIKVVAPGAFGIVAEHAFGFLDGDA